MSTYGISNEDDEIDRSAEHTSELQSQFRISYAVFCLKTKIFSEPPFIFLFIFSWDYDLSQTNS